MKLDEIKQLLESNDFKVPSEANREGTNNTPTAKTPAPKQAGGELSPETLKSQSPSNTPSVQKRRGDKSGTLPAHGEAPKEEKVGLSNPETIDGQKWEKSEVPVKQKIDKLAEQRQELVSVVMEYAAKNDIDLDVMSEEEISDLIGAILEQNSPNVLKRLTSPKAVESGTAKVVAAKAAEKAGNKAPSFIKDSLESQITDAILEYAQEYDIDLETISESEMSKLYDAAFKALTEGDHSCKDLPRCFPMSPPQNKKDGNKNNHAPSDTPKHVAPKDTKKHTDSDTKNLTDSIDTAFTLTDQLGSLLESEGLTEEFKSQAITVFEAAVNSAAKGHIEVLEEKFQTQLEESVEQIKQELNENTEKYLDYVVSEWMNENKIAIESATRNNVAESFMGKLKDLLEEHYIELPAEKADLYEQEVSRSKRLSEELNRAVKERSTLVEQVESLVKQVKVERFVRNMTEVEAEKVRELSESVELDNNFEKKIKTLHENYFPSKKPSSSMLTEDMSEQKVEKQLPVDMEAYIKFMSKMNS